jgi:uncharacterized protein (TIGR02172 family)
MDPEQHPEERLAAEQLIGTGLTSEVFSWGPDQALKLFLAWIQPEAIERELAVTQAIRAAGAPAPAAFRSIRVGTRVGLIFERIRGRSLLQQVEARPWKLFAAARLLADLHAQIHSYSATQELPTQSEQLLGWIRDADEFTEAQKAQALDRLTKLPEGRTICHGDFHPGNVLLTKTGPIIIDWSVATRGHPPTDIARTSVLFESAKLPPQTRFNVRLLMKFSRRLLHSTYLNRSLALGRVTIEEIELWRGVQRLVGSGWRAQRKAAMIRSGMLEPATTSRVRAGR